MKRFKNILLFSKPETEQDDAIRRAGSLAKQNGASLTILSVIKGPLNEISASFAGTSIEELQARIISERQIHAEKLASELRQDGVEVQVKIVCGTAFIEVIREVLRAQHDLVILAAEGKRSLITRLLGSTSMHLMRKCPCPVWVVKPSRRTKYKRILAAVDTTIEFSEPERVSLNPLILQLASSMALMDKSELHVVQVWSVFGEGYMEIRGGLSEKSIRNIRKDAKQQYARELDNLLASVDMNGVPVHAHLSRAENTASAIIKLAKNKKIDLLVMGTICRTGVAGFFIGNTAEKVLSEVNCSVLTVKPEGFVTPVTLEQS